MFKNSVLSRGPRNGSTPSKPAACGFASTVRRSHQSSKYSGGKAFGDRKKKTGPAGIGGVRAGLGGAVAPKGPSSYSSLLLRQALHQSLGPVLVSDSSPFATLARSPQGAMRLMRWAGSCEAVAAILFVSYLGPQSVLFRNSQVFFFDSASFVTYASWLTVVVGCAAPGIARRRGLRILFLFNFTDA